VSREIKISCQGATTIPFARLTAFQGDLKSLHKDDYEKLRKQILELGFSDPIAVWKSQGSNFILNGHQRFRVIETMAGEGYRVPDLPVVLVHADDFKQAKRKVLALTSQYGKIDKQGLYEFLHEADIDAEELDTDFKLSGIDPEKFLNEFYEDEPDLDVVTEENNPSKIVHTCPGCGMEFR